MFFRQKKSQGFTLIELLVAIAIIVILSVIIIANVATSRAKSRDTIRIGDVKQLQQAIQTYFSTCYAYPASLSNLSSDCTGAKLLTSIPIDPSTKLNYAYATSSSPMKFHVCATLETNTSTNGRAGIGAIPGAVSDSCDGTKVKVFDLTGGL